jgi:hypothetical protein
VNLPIPPNSKVEASSVKGGGRLDFCPLEVSEIVHGQFFLARDLIGGGEPIQVTEATATKMLKQWDRIAARIVPRGDARILSGGVLQPDYGRRPRARVQDRSEDSRQIQMDFGPGHMLRSEPGAFLALHKPLRDPGLGEFRLAEPPAAAMAAT